MKSTIYFIIAIIKLVDSVVLTAMITIDVHVCMPCLLAFKGHMLIYIYIFFAKYGEMGSVGPEKQKIKFKWSNLLGNIKTDRCYHHTLMGNVNTKSYTLSFKTPTQNCHYALGHTPSIFALEEPWTRGTVAWNIHVYIILICMYAKLNNLSYVLSKKNMKTDNDTKFFCMFLAHTLDLIRACRPLKEKRACN